MNVDVAKLCAELRAGLKGVTPGPWDIAGYNIDGPVGNGDYVVLGEAWSSHESQAHIARCSPDNIAALLDALDAAERERDEARARALEQARDLIRDHSVQYGEGQRLTPRMEGERNGLAYAEAINALIEKDRQP